ncbi:hypothetical protein HOY80DRAFT_1017149 [Tuber brumale]|nr:hypothetical protein HOY80DRAFT_1017149 [Tuber brumale]
MAPRCITLVRHGEAYHNIVEGCDLYNPYLTSYGKLQCDLLSRVFPSQPPVDLLVSSPMKRAMRTPVLGFERQIESSAKECSDSPCDTGSSRDMLKKEKLFQGLAFSGLPDDWTSNNCAHADGYYKEKWAPNSDSLKERARAVRQWLKSRSEEHVVLALHGGNYLENPEHRPYVLVDNDQGNTSFVQNNESKEWRKRSQERERAEMRHIEGGWWD